MTHPRICLPTGRGFSRLAFQCGYLEAQDVLAECAEVDLLGLEPVRGFDTKLRWLRRLMYRDVSRRLAFVNPGLKPLRLTQDYDVLVMMCAGYWDFLYINAIDGWKDRCKTSVIWIDELYASDLPLFKYWLPSLRRFDQVIVGMHGTVAPLSEMLERACHYVPGAVDTLRFSPYPDVPDRVIDVYSVGRRVEALHQALLLFAEKSGMFYQHDTLQATSMSTAPDHREHRNLYASVAKRSRLFMVAPGKVNLAEETGGQVEVAFRYYEGLASGTVMVGQAPQCQPFREMFPWPEAVTHVKADGSDVAHVLSELAADRPRLERLSRRNACEALLRHDWIHRWKRVLEIAGVPAGPGIEGREQSLRDLAEIGRSR